MMERRAVVRALKFGLPALALAVFGSLFVFSSARYSGGVSFDGVDVSSLREGLRLQNPRFTGATKAGEPFSITADWAEPDAPRPTRVELSRVAGEINLADGRIVTLSAEAGVLEPQANILTLTDGVAFASSDGYAISASTARFDADREMLTARGKVAAEGALGRITSDDMRAMRDGEKGAYIWFENRVKVRIDKPNLAQEPG